MTTFGLALVFLALLMLYCGVKGKSLRAALLGHSVDGGSGSLLGGTSSSAATGSSTAGTGQSSAGTFLQSHAAPR